MIPARGLPVALALLLLLAGCSPGPPARPNFVILIADDLGWNDLGAYGNRDVQTPRIDQLARQGLQFSQAFLTTSSCSASRASILSGRYPHSNGLVHLHQALPADQRTVAAYLGEAGYFTAAAGKWHIGTSAKEDFDRVVDDREGSGTGHWLDLLRSRPSERSFFLWLGSRDPHRPSDGGQEFRDRYQLPLQLPEGFVDGPGVQQELLDYYLEISRFDHDVGRVVDELERQGVLDSTLVIVMSDNGRPFHRAKLTLYDDGIKTPLIMAWPEGIRAAGHYRHLVSSIDLAPTLLELAGLEVPASMQGHSLVPAIWDREARIRDYVFAERNWHGKNAHERAVRSTEFLYKENQFPLHGDCTRTQFSQSEAYRALDAARRRGELDEVGRACFRAERERTELFAASFDGIDYRNLAADPEYREVRAELKRELDGWRESTGDFDYQPYERPE
jgi:N-sulfoglucosamine sulfohydrolase